VREAIGKKISELIDTGKMKAHEELLKKHPKQFLK
jgi:DNA polymerase/3'-5' exonuclease PolX